MHNTDKYHLNHNINHTYASVLFIQDNFVMKFPDFLFKVLVIYITSR